jgi:hypothetical protein
MDKPLQIRTEFICLKNAGFPPQPAPVQAGKGMKKLPDP